MPPLTDPLHLYRALLRECTYLPDPNARIRLRGHVRSSFRAYIPRSLRSLPFSPNLWEAPISSVYLLRETGLRGGRQRTRRPTPSPPRQSHVLRQARKGLYTLQRANGGYYKPLMKILCFTYGQIGRRRYELLKEFLKSDPWLERDTANLLAKDWGVGEKYKIGARLDALIKSRQRHAGQFTLRPEVKLSPIPETNLWGRPMPMKRLQNLQQRRYARLLEGICPPLPEGDWNHVQSLASDKKNWEGPVPRRSRPGADVPSEDSATMNGHFLVTSPERAPSHEDNLRGRPHKLTKRFMRGIWQTLFNDCCRITGDSDKKQWDVEWGFMQKKERKRVFVHKADMDRDAALFGDINGSSSISDQL